MSVRVDDASGLVLINDEAIVLLESNVADFINDGLVLITPNMFSKLLLSALRSAPLKQRAMMRILSLVTEFTVSISKSRADDCLTLALASILSINTGLSITSLYSSSYSSLKTSNQLLWST